MNPVEIKLMGEKISLKTDASPVEAQAIVDLVSDRLAAAQERSRKGTSPHHVALLALLEMGAEMVRSKRRFNEHQKEMSERAEQILLQLDPPR